MLAGLDHCKNTGLEPEAYAAKYNFYKISKIPNQGARIMNCVMRSTPIQALETTTGLESIDSRKDTKVFIQSAKFQRLHNHPMDERIVQPNRRRIKRDSFLHQTRALERENEMLNGQEIQSIFQELQTQFSSSKGQI